MQFFITLLMAGALLAAPDHQSHQHNHHHEAQDPPSVHGMAVFGTDKIYLSHLPMFHSPHDYQVILEVELDEAGREAYLSSQGKGEQLHTIAPEEFVLTEKIGVGATFGAALYQGHFERGGERLLENAAVRIKRVIQFTKLDPSARKSDTGKFLYLSGRTQGYLVHQISGRPDFDQILRTGKVSGLKDGMILTSAAPAMEALPEGRNELTDDLGTAHSLQTRSLYLEFGDLAH